MRDHELDMAGTVERTGERGSALIIAILVTVILTLLGISFLMMAETENKIAENERLSAQTLYVAESAARQVKRWFDHPPRQVANDWNVLNPPLAAIDRTLRQIDHDGDPATAPIPQNGGSAPMYKQSDATLIFDRPYRPLLEHTLLGTEAGPDMRISTATSAGETFLDALSAEMFPNYPGDGRTARITQLDIYGPPTIEISGSWTRYGMATVRVMAQIVQDVNGTEVVLAERMVKAVLNEMPYPGPFGPLHSCANLTYGGDFTVNWGAASAVADSDVSNNFHKIKASLPRIEPPGQRVDLLWGYDAGAGNAAPFNDYMAQVYAANEEIEDPWFRYLSGGPLDDATVDRGTNPTADDVVPWPFDWTVGTSVLDDGTYPNHDHGGSNDGTHSNVMQNMPTVTCPQFDYEIWKAIATSGTSDVHYYVWDNGTSFRENGNGSAQTFRSITDNVEGLFFFDTKDSVRPYDNDGDGLYDNLTPPISLSGGTHGMRGLIYINAETFQSKGINGRAVTMAAPGEPWLDIDQDGVYDVGEPWVNLAYPGNISAPFVADAADALLDDGTFGASAVRNGKGPDFASTALMWGILYNSGQFEATGNARYYGSVVGESGVGENSPAAGTPEFYWDESIAENWPPEEWDLPRVVITRWETDL